MERAKFFASNLRHINSRRVERSLLPLEYAKVRGWMKIAQQVWLWYFKCFSARYGDGNVPEKQYKEFQESF